MSKKQKGKKYFKTDTRENIRKSLQKLVHAVQNDEIEVAKANCICKIIQLELEMLEDDVLRQVDELEEQIRNLTENGGL